MWWATSVMASSAWSGRLCGPLETRPNFRRGSQRVRAPWGIAGGSSDAAVGREGWCFVRPVEIRACGVAPRLLSLVNCVDPYAVRWVTTRE
jgi:hypothetical protein